MISRNFFIIPPKKALIPQLEISPLQPRKKCGGVCGGNVVVKQPPAAVGGGSTNISVSGILGITRDHVKIKQTGKSLVGV
jgi:hypothetical protein